MFRIYLFLISHFFSVGLLHAIYDVSIAYRGTFPRTEQQLCQGILPEEVYFHIQRHSAHEIPTQESELSAWCEERWQEKEARLHSFYNGERLCDHRPKANEHSTVLTDVIPTKVNGLTEQNNNQTATHSYPTFMYRVTVTIYSLFMLAAMLLMYVTPLARFYAFALIIFFFTTTSRYGGMELLQTQVNSGTVNTN